MDTLSLQKQACLWSFSFLMNYFNHNLVPPNETYDNKQPSNGIEQRLMRTVFFDTMLDLVPHAQAGLVHDPSKAHATKLLFLSIIGRMWPSSPYRFTSELDYTATMSSLDFQCAPTTQSPKHVLNSLLDDYVGYGLVTQQSQRCVIDARYLKQFEIRPHYSPLDVVLVLNSNLHFDYCRISGVKRIDDLAIRECITTIFTISTIERHLFNIHLLISDQFCMLLASSLQPTHPFYRLLRPMAHSPYKANETASILLLGQTGLCQWLNFTRKGLGQYFAHVKRTFRIRDVLMPNRKRLGPSTVHKHSILWYRCIQRFVAHFLAIQTAESLECDEFLQQLKVTYHGIYDESKSQITNLRDIGSMIIYACSIQHELYSNPRFSKLSTNPFCLSTTWKQNDSTALTDKINNLGEQLEVNFVASVTANEAIRLDDERWVDMCCISQAEKHIYKAFHRAIAQLEIPEDAILHPKNISSSVRY